MSIDLARVIAVAICVFGVGSTMYLRRNTKSPGVAGPAVALLMVLIILMPWIGNDQNMASQRMPAAVFLVVIVAVTAVALVWSMKFRK